MSKYLPYTLVGSREIPPEIETKLFEIAAALAKKGYTIRSGGADGSDLAGENGARSVDGLLEIYVPWQGFNNNPSKLTWIKEAFDMASTIHPVWDRLKLGAKQLHARNCHQVLGKDLKSPSLFLVAYTENGDVKGGTATALTLAALNGIPIFNLGLPNGLDKFREFYKNMK